MDGKAEGNGNNNETVCMCVYVCAVGFDVGDRKKDQKCVDFEYIHLILHPMMCCMNYFHFLRSSFCLVAKVEQKSDAEPGCRANC